MSGICYLCEIIYFLCKCNLLHFNLFGFSTNHSTDMAVSQFVDNLNQAIDNYRVGFFI